MTRADALVQLVRAERWVRYYAARMAVWREQRREALDVLIRPTKGGRR